MRESKFSAFVVLAFGMALAASVPVGAQSGGLQFDGSNDYVTFGPASALGVSTFTIETWFKRTGAGATTTTGSGGVTAVPLMTKGRGEADGSNVDMNWFLGLAGDRLCADFEAYSGGQNYPVTATRAVTLNEWHHAAVTYDGTTWRLYLDGVLDTSLTVGATPRYDSIQHAALATALTSTGSAQGFFAGVLDEARVWNHARTPEEVAAGMYATIPSASGLVGRWSLDDGSGATAVDTSGSNLTGTLMNGPVWVAGAPMIPVPTCALVSPAHQSVVAGPVVNFVCQAQDAVGLVSAALYVGQAGQPLAEIEVQPVSGASATVVFTTTLQDGQNYEWNCLVVNTSGQQAWAPANFQLLVDGNYPAIPSLVAPADGATEVPTTATLQAGVSDPNGDALTATFYGWKPAADFALAVLPDTQNYSQSYPSIFTAQTTWIVNNASGWNIVFVAHEGDVVNSYSDLTQYSRANTSMSLLDGVVPYGIAPGNHDLPSANFNATFPYTRYESQPWYGGHYGANNDNSYQLFSAGGLDFIVIHMAHHPSAEVITWADGVLKAHANRKAILVTHAFLNTAGARFDNDYSYSTEYIWEGLVVPNDNVFFVLCGHDSGEIARTDMVNGRQVHQLLADYQSRANGGNGWMRLMRFVPSEGRVYVLTYSPYLDQFETDTDSEFTLDFPMRQFQVIGTQSVSSGSTAEAVWTGLAYETPHEWFAEVTDSTGRSTVGPVWHFITVADNTPKPYDAFVAQNPTLSIGTLGGNGIAGTTTADDGLTQTVTEASDGVGASMSAEYLLHTTADPAKVLAFTLYFAGSWTALDANDPLRVQIWNTAFNGGQGGWENITADVADGTFAPPTSPQSYVDAQGGIRVLFQDSASVRREKKDKLTVDHLMARVIAGIPDAEPPAAPSGLGATTDDLAVTLTWTAPADPDVAGYRVYRSTEPGAGYGLLTGSFLAGTTYADTTPAAGTYYYVVTAVDSSGNESASSNEAMATTTEPPADTIHVGALSLTVAKVSTKWRATAAVRVDNQIGSPMAGAVVTGDWYLKGALIQTGASGATGADGTASLTSPSRTAKSGDVFRFVVTGLSLTGCIYDPAANMVSEGTVAVP